MKADEPITTDDRNPILIFCYWLAEVQALRELEVVGGLCTTNWIFEITRLILALPRSGAWRNVSRHALDFRG